MHYSGYVLRTRCIVELGGPGFVVQPVGPGAKQQTDLISTSSSPFMRGLGHIDPEYVKSRTNEPAEQVDDGLRALLE